MTPDSLLSQSCEGDEINISYLLSYTHDSRMTTSVHELVHQAGGQKLGGVFCVQSYNLK